MKHSLTQEAEQVKAPKKHIPLSFYFKFGSIAVLVLMSVIVVACSNASDPTKGATFGPAPTVTIQLGNNGSPAASVAKLQCGAWATQQTPNINTTSQIGVYGKFVMMDNNMNPRGVDGADVNAVVHWADGTAQPMTGKTTADGLVVFAVSLNNRDGALYKLTLVTMTFTKQGVGQCVIDDTKNPASFTLVNATPNATGTPVSQKTPKPTKTPKRGGGGANGNGNSTNPTGNVNSTPSPNSTSTDIPPTVGITATVGATK